MKKILFLLLTLMLLGTFALPALAADNTHRLMNNGQDALLVGEVVEVTEDYILFQVLRTVSGTPPRSPFQLNNDGSYMLQRANFAPGDGILASVRFVQRDIRRAGEVQQGVFNVEVMPDTKIRMCVDDWDAGWIEWYVNTGERELAGVGERVYRNINFERGELLFDGEQWHMDSHDPAFRAPRARWVPFTPLLTLIFNEPSDLQLLQLLFSYAFVGISGIAIGVFIGRKMRKKKIK